MDVPRLANSLRWFTATCIALAGFGLALVWIDLRASNVHPLAHLPALILIILAVTMLACGAAAYFVERHYARGRRSGAQLPGPQAAGPWLLRR